MRSINQLSSNVSCLSSLLFVLCLLIAGGAAAGAQTGRGRRVNAESFPGADIGARINAADKSLGAAAGEIVVSSGGTISTQVVVSPGHTLRLRGGVYKANTPGPPILLGDNTTLVADSWDAVLEETTAPLVAGGTSPVTGQSVFTIVQDLAGNRRNGDPASGIRVSGVHVRGARTDHYNSSFQTISLGNCRNCVVEKNFLEDTRTIGIQFGGAAAYGHYAADSKIVNNVLAGVASQNIAVTNGVRLEISGNRMERPGQPGGPGVSVIDVEPNVGDRVEDIMIHDNVVDCMGSAVDAGGAKCTNGIVVNNGNGAKPFRNVQVFKNTVLGQPVGREIATKRASGITYAGILVRTASGVTVRGNTVRRVVTGIRVDYESSDNVVEGNLLVGCGTGGEALPLMVVDSRRNLIKGNLLEEEPGDTYQLGERALIIIEGGTADENQFEGNRGKVHRQGRRSRVVQ